MGSITIPKDAETGTRIFGYHYSSDFSGSIGVYYDKTKINIDGNWCAVSGIGGSGADESLTVYWR